ncbi:MAG TPA: type II toxin-antitoxin system RelB/DinJ family antitoxin [Mycobacterium sp.]|nr:type II toxin-antitoxin system RelB/DinJ family antitoxin [Mycobacterium sp.]
MAVKALIRRVAAVEKTLARRKMAKTTTIRARVSPELKIQVEKILAELGLSPSEAMRLFYHQVSKHKGLPFPMRIPNALTRKALDDAEAGKNLTRAADADDMFRKLGIKCGEGKA